VSSNFFVFLGFSGELNSVPRLDDEELSWLDSAEPEELIEILSSVDSEDLDDFFLLFFFDFLFLFCRTGR